MNMIVNNTSTQPQHPPYLCDTSDHVEDKGLDRSETCNMLAAALPYSKGHDVRFLCLDKPDVHIYMTDILVERPSRAGDSDETGLDANGDTLWYFKLFSFENVPHL